MTGDELRQQLLTPPPAPKRSLVARVRRRVDLFLHDLGYCNDRLRVAGSVRACSVCGDLRTVR